MLPVQGLAATALIGSIAESQVTGLVTDLAATEKTANKNQSLGYAGLNASSQVTAALALKTQVPNLDESQITNLPSDLAATEKTANKGAASGYAGLNASSQLTNNLAAKTQVPNLDESQITNLSTDLAATEKTANKGIASGYAGLNASSQLTNNLSSKTQVPNLDESQITNLQTDLAATEKTANKGVAGGYAGLNGSSLITNNLAGTVLSGGNTIETQNNKNVANGYAGLDASSFVPTANVSDKSGWKEIGRTILGVAGTTITVSGLANFKYLWIRCYLKSDGSGTLVYPNLRFNNDSGSNYTYGRSYNNTAKAQSSGITFIELSNSTTNENFEINIWVVNVSTDIKIVSSKAVTSLSNDQDCAGIWSNTVNTISEVDIVMTSGTSKYAIGSEVVVMGRN